MFIILNALAASLDGYIIGISLKLSKTKLTLKNNLIILFTNFFIYTTIIVLYYSFKCRIMTTSITTILYIILAWNAYKEKEEHFEKALTTKKAIILAAAHSLDGSLVSLNFVYEYNLIYIILLFGITSLVLLLIGYYFANLFKSTKKSNFISALLFILLAIFNLFL